LTTSHRPEEEEMMVVDSKNKDTQVIQGRHQVSTPPRLRHPHLAMTLNNNNIIITKQDLHR